MLDVHLRGAFYVTQPAWQLMRDQGYGRIVNTSSGAGIFGNFGQTNYGAAKMGLVGFTRVLAVEGAKNNIKANAIAPVAKTRMTEELLGPLADKLGPELVTPVVTYLAHEDCPVTGEVYSVGGGRVARVFIGVTPGLRRRRASPPRPSRDNFDKIRAEEGYEVPGQPQRGDDAHDEGAVVATTVTVTPERAASTRPRPGRGAPGRRRRATTGRSCRRSSSTRAVPGSARSSTPAGPGSTGPTRSAAGASPWSTPRPGPAPARWPRCRR